MSVRAHRSALPGELLAHNRRNIDGHIRTSSCTVMLSRRESLCPAVGRCSFLIAAALPSAVARLTLGGPTGVFMLNCAALCKLVMLVERRVRPNLVYFFSRPIRSFCTRALVIQQTRNRSHRQESADVDWGVVTDFLRGL